ncbi:hypothetical protein ACEPAH_7486 [Sanghuangporus vaninii]
MSSTHWPDQVNLTHYVPASTEAQRAASLACGLIQIHPVRDGNKRTAELVVNEYLKAHGFLTRSPSSAQNDQEAHFKVASGKMDDTKLAEVHAQALGKVNMLMHVAS